MRSRRGASFAVLSAVGTGRFEIAVSVPLVLEYDELLIEKAKASVQEVTRRRNVIDYLCAVAKKQSIFFLWRPCLSDPDDDMLLELAVAAGCDAIVTHNQRHLVPARQFGIQVVTPAAFLEELGGIL